jgi:hypothetical protein
MAIGLSLRLRRQPLTAAPLAGAFPNVLARRVCISDGRLNQQQRRCGEEQKVFHDILLAFLKNLELATGAGRLLAFLSFALTNVYVGTAAMVARARRKRTKRRPEIARRG